MLTGFSKYHGDSSLGFPLSFSLPFHSRLNFFLDGTVGALWSLAILNHSFLAIGFSSSILMRIVCI